MTGVVFHPGTPASAWCWQPKVSYPLAPDVGHVRQLLEKHKHGHEEARKSESEVEAEAQALKRKYLAMRQAVAHQIQMPSHVACGLEAPFDNLPHLLPSLRPDELNIGRRRISIVHDIPQPSFSSCEGPQEQSSILELNIGRRRISIVHDIPQPSFSSCAPAKVVEASTPFGIGELVERKGSHTAVVKFPWGIGHISQNLVDTSRSALLHSQAQRFASICSVLIASLLTLSSDSDRIETLGTGEDDAIEKPTPTELTNLVNNILSQVATPCRRSSVKSTSSRPVSSRPANGVRADTISETDCRKPWPAAADALLAWLVKEAVCPCLGHREALDEIALYLGKLMKLHTPNATKHSSRIECPEEVTSAESHLWQALRLHLDVLDELAKAKEETPATTQINKACDKRGVGVAVVVATSARTALLAPEDRGMSGSNSGYLTPNRWHSSSPLKIRTPLRLRSCRRSASGDDLAISPLRKCVPVEAVAMLQTTASPLASPCSDTPSRATNVAMCSVRVPSPMCSVRVPSPMCSVRVPSPQISRPSGRYSSPIVARVCRPASPGTRFPLVSATTATVGPRATPRQND